MRAVSLTLVALTACGTASSTSGPPPLEREPTAAPAPPPLATPLPTPTFVEHDAPGGLVETCRLLAKFPFEPPDLAADPGTMRWYRADDFADVEALCAIDLYQDERLGVCPKLYASSPALDLHDLSGTKLTKSKFERERCRRAKKRGAPKVAKLKFRAWANEIESALLYFHFSRLLGNAGFVYPATARTVVRTELRTRVRDAIAIIDATGIDSTRDGWGVLRSRLKKKTDALVDGSLAKNPRGEDTHRQFKYGTRKFTINRTEHWRTQPYYKLVASDRAVPATIGPQALAYAEDFTNLVVMDHLFNARDRLGNIHSKTYAHYVDDAGHLRWKKDDDDVSVPLKRLLLKDNDDGLVWNKHSRLSTTPLVGELRHLDALLYGRIQWLAGLMSDAETAALVRAYFVDAVGVRGETYDVVQKRFVAMAERFARAHDRGDLTLDIDLAAALAR